MNRLRIVGLVLLAVLAGWLVLRSCTPQAPEPAVPVPPPREEFHASKPLRIEVVQGAAPLANWFDRELRNLLIHGKMKLAPIGDPATDASALFTLRVTLDEQGANAELALIAPDTVIERRESIALTSGSQLATMQRLAQSLPKFVSAPANNGDWSAFLGTSDAGAYAGFLRAADELVHAHSTGFTAPPSPSQDAVANVERLEAITRKQRAFVRARVLLALAYLNVGGEDAPSLAKLAETAAERALAADGQLADAHAALGIVQLRRMNWSGAQEHFEAALAIDPNSLPALEGLGCLLMDTGHAKQALPIASRAARLQPGNRGARQCARYAQIADGQKPNTAEEPSDIARIRATMLLLSGDRSGAEALLRGAAKLPAPLIESVIAANAAKSRVPEALQIITSAADDESIDADTELLLGTALRRPDFVFNRMLRMTKHDEAVPLRLLWLPQTEFLRKQRRFKEIVSAASFTTYWQDHGVPDICANEPKVHGCAVKAKQ